MTSEKLQTRKNILFCGLCCLVYFSSYITRINYGAAIAEIIFSLGITKAMASMAVTGSFVTYGLGQIVSGIIGDRIKPKTMIFVGMLLTSICNISMSGLSNVYIMTAVWCVNGFAQSMLWPPLTRIMSENLTPERYQKTCVLISTSSSAATIIIYLIVPLFIVLSGWRMVFSFSAIWGIVVAFIWLLSISKLTVTETPDVKKINSRKNSSPANIRSVFSLSGLLPIMFIILMQGILRDGITTWMPSYINDIFHFGTSISILSTVVLPIFAIISVFAASYVFKIAKNEVSGSAAIWILSLVCCFALIFVYKSYAMVSILLTAIITGCMHGVNLMLISIFPLRYKETGRVSTVSGILNAFTYGGSAISSYGIAAISDGWGWKITIITWFAIALCGTAVNIFFVNKYKRTQTAK